MTTVLDEMVARTNCTQFIFVTGASTSIPVVLQDRRYFVLEIEPKVAQPFWAQQGKRKKGGRRRY